MVGNYRAQVDSIIETSSYAELLARIRTKLRELAGGVLVVGLTESLPRGSWDSSRGRRVPRIYRAGAK